MYINVFNACDDLALQLEYACTREFLQQICQYYSCIPQLKYSVQLKYFVQRTL